MFQRIANKWIRHEAHISYAYKLVDSKSPTILDILSSQSPKILVMDTLVDTSMDTSGRQCENQDYGGAKRARRAQIAQLAKLYNEFEKIMISYDNMENVKQL